MPDENRERKRYMWEFNDERPIFTQLAEQITSRIVSGEFSPGQKLDSVRELAFQAQVSPNTMQKALAQLEQDGLVFSQRTSGRFITEDTAMLNEVKTKLAIEQITALLEKLGKLGLSHDDAIDLIKKVKPL